MQWIAECEDGGWKRTREKEKNERENEQKPWRRGLAKKKDASGGVCLE